MPLQTRRFPGSRLREAEYDTDSQQLDLRWDDGRVLAYKHVPAEVFRRLGAAPNPATYWEDRIAEEYPKGTPRKKEGAERPKDLKDLFGGGDDDDGPAS